MRIGLEDSHKASLNKERRYGRIEGVERLHIGKRRIVSQDAERDLVEMCKARGGPKKIEGST